MSLLCHPDTDFNVAAFIWPAGHEDNFLKGHQNVSFQQNGASVSGSWKKRSRQKNRREHFSDNWTHP